MDTNGEPDHSCPSKKSVLDTEERIRAEPLMKPASKGSQAKSSEMEHFLVLMTKEPQTSSQVLVARHGLRASDKTDMNLPGLVVFL